MCINVLSLCMSAHHMSLVPRRSEESIRSPGTGVIDAMWVLETGPRSTARATRAPNHWPQATFTSQNLHWASVGKVTTEHIAQYLRTSYVYDGGHLLCPLVSSMHLEECLAQGRYSIYLMNEWINLKQKMPSGKSSPQDGGSHQAPKVKGFSMFQPRLAPSLQLSGTMGLLSWLTNAFMFLISVQPLSRFRLCNATSESA